MRLRAIRFVGRQWWEVGSWGEGNAGVASGVESVQYGVDIVEVSVIRLAKGVEGEREAISGLAEGGRARD